MSGAQRYVDRPLPARESPRLLKGQGTFAADFNRQGQLHARIVRSDVAYGRIRQVDPNAAQGCPGVVCVLTSDDLPDVRIPIRMMPSDNASQALQSPLARNHVRYVGDPIAVVVAEDPYLAEDAAQQVQVDIEPLEAIVTTEEAMAAKATLLHPNLDSNVIDRRAAAEDENLDALFADAAIVVKDRLHVHRHGAVPMEPRGLLAEYDAEGPFLTLWGAAKVKHFNRRALAEMLELPETTVRLVEGDVGGAFGARGELYPEDFLIPWLAIRLGRPVKWVEDRRENLIALNQSREQDWEMEMAADSDGNLLCFRAAGAFNQGAYVRTHGGVLLPSVMINHIVGPYRWRAFHVETCSVVTNKTPAGTYRGPCQYEPTYVRERMLDILARELDLDPAEIRRRNMVSKEDMPYRPGLTDLNNGEAVVYDGSDYLLVFESLLEHIGYDSLREQVGERQAEGQLMGLSATAFIEMGAPGPFEQARVVPKEEGRFDVYVGVASVGQGVETVLSQIAADALGVPIERVKVDFRDTDTAPEGFGAFSSRSTVMGGHAIIGAARDLVAKARAAAGAVLDVSPTELGISGGFVERHGKGGLEKIALDELGVTGEHRHVAAASDVMMGANVALVELDEETGEVKIVRFAIAYDVGRAINPLLLEGQMRGAAAQGLAGALFEEFAYSPDGQPLSTSFLDYAMPTAAEIPEIELVIHGLAERHDDSPMAGAKGGGEGGIVGTAATVANAVADALGDAGRGLTQLPITPETVQRLATLVQARPARSG